MYGRGSYGRSSYGHSPAESGLGLVVETEAAAAVWLGGVSRVEIGVPSSAAVTSTLGSDLDLAIAFSAATTDWLGGSLPSEAGVVAAPAIDTTLGASVDMSITFAAGATEWVDFGAETGIGSETVSSITVTLGSPSVASAENPSIASATTWQGESAGTELQVETSADITTAAGSVFPSGVTAIRGDYARTSVWTRAYGRFSYGRGSDLEIVLQPTGTTAWSGSALSAEVQIGPVDAVHVFQPFAAATEIDAFTVAGITIWSGWPLPERPRVSVFFLD